LRDWVNLAFLALIFGALCLGWLWLMHFEEVRSWLAMGLSGLTMWFVWSLGTGRIGGPRKP
jgi:hypothetical protein